MNWPAAKIDLAAVGFTPDQISDIHGCISPLPLTEDDKTPPPNPHYRRYYQTNINGGQVCLTIPAPGNVITKDDAEYLIEWFGLILRQLKRIADSEGGGN